MAKAVFHRRFDATDIKKGVSIRIEPMDAPQSFPEWVIAKAEAEGAATRQKPKPQADAGKTGDK
ncbi:MAG: hypothetical protein VYB46_08530 [Pseudomonadota bacterium]|nr:hypothetical protein [Pseudomonadota bacterium]